MPFTIKKSIFKWKKYKRFITFYIKRFWLIFVIGQILSLMITASSTFVTKLNDYHIDIPTFQTFLNYASLALIYTSFTIYSYGFKKWANLILKDGWKYFILAFIDVEANFLVAYGYTNILSCMLLNLTYNIEQILGILICFMGLIMLTISNLKTKKNNKAKNPIKGDIFMIVGSSLYGLSNLLEEVFVSKQPIYEVTGQLGFWGIFINIIQVYIFERNSIKNIQWSKETIGFMLGYNMSLFIFYSLTPILLRMSSAVFYNISLLTSNFWGLITYHLFFKNESKKPWIHYDYGEGIYGIGAYKASTDSQTQIIHKSSRNLHLDISEYSINYLTILI
ncbi:hypothetical protein PCK2_000064 [Pneumocystis canis]|nr:hypothetical protein PCK2_000064 [Pneumocystis canis]